MRQFPLRWHEHLARLDGPRERRMIAFALLMAVAGFAFGAPALRAARAVMNPPAVLVADAGGASDAAMVLTASVTGGEFTEVLFLVSDDRGVTRVFPAKPDGVGSVWTHPNVPVEAGTPYTIRSQGRLATGEIVLSSNAASASRQGAGPARVSSPSAATPNDAATGVRLSTLTDEALPGRLQFRLEGAVDVAHAAFEALGPDGRTSVAVGSFSAGNIWIGELDLAPGRTYQVVARTFAPSGEAGPVAFETVFVPHGPATAAQVNVFVSAAVSSGPQTLLARVDGTGATGAIFEIEGPDGIRLNIPAVGEAASFADASASGTVWTAVFDGSPGAYRASARVSLTDGRVTQGGSATFEISPVSFPTPVQRIELVSPAESSAHSGAAPLSARVAGAEALRVLFVVMALDGSETLVVSRHSTVTGYWSSHFEAPNGTYVVRARADLEEGGEWLSDARLFTITATNAPATP